MINYLFKPRTLKMQFLECLKIIRYKLFPLFYYKYSFAEDLYMKSILHSEKLIFIN